MSENYPFKVLKEVEVRPFVRKLYRFSSVIFLLLVAMLFLPWEQTIQGSGKLIAYNPVERNYDLKATYTGFIKHYFVKENQHLKKGDPICELEDQDPQFGTRLKEKERILLQQLDELRNRYTSLQNERKEIEQYYTHSIVLFETRDQKSREQLKKLEFERKALEKNLETKEKHYNRVKTLYQTGVESKRKLEATHNEYTQAKASYDQGLIAIEIEKQNLMIINKDKQRFENEQKAKLQQNHQALAQANVNIESVKSQLLDANTNIQRYESRIIKADKDGTVVRIYHSDKNRLIHQGEAILHFVPKVRQRSLLLKMSDFHMPLIKEGLPARIMFYGWPAMQVSGWPKINHGTFAGYVHAIEPISHEAGFYYVHIFEDPDEPWPSQDLLRIGTQATAWIRLETVPIWYQIWRYINSMPPNMPKGPKK